MKYALPLAALATLLSACRLTVPSDGAPATPQRPTFSTNTSTTAEGTVEVEGGLLVDPGDYYDTPVAVKWGSTPSTEFFLGFSPYQKVDVDGRNGSSFGDTLIGVRQRVQETGDGEVATAFELSTKLPTADGSEDIGTGELDFFAAGIIDIRGPGFGWTGFYQLGLLGEVGDEGVDVRHLGSLTADVPLDEQVSVFGELAIILTPEQDQELGIVTLGTAFRPRPSFVLDTAIQIGIGSDAPDFAFVVGFTQNLGRILD